METDMNTLTSSPPSSTAIDFFPTSYSETGESNLYVGGGHQSFPDTTISSTGGNGRVDGFEEEAPLWEELGFDLEFIKAKTLSLLLLRGKLDNNIVKDEDLGGPLIFCVLLGFCLLLQGGKFHFGYIFGYSFIGGILVYILLNLMSEQSIGISHTISVLGYCLAPMILLALASIVFPPTHIIGFTLAVLTIAYCTHAASSTFMKILQTTDQRFLFAYPIGLLYACFALIVMF